MNDQSTGEFRQIPIKHPMWALNPNYVDRGGKSGMSASMSHDNPVITGYKFQQKWLVFGDNPKTEIRQMIECAIPEREEWRDVPIVEVEI